MHVVITGAAGALGREVARVLSYAGYELTGIGRSNAIDDVPELNHRVAGIDLADPDQAQTALATAAEAAGPIEALVNAAGGFAWETVADGDPETWDRLFAANLRTALNASRAALPYLDSGASIVNVGAAAATRAGPGMGAYTASKSAVARLTESLAEELKERRIRVNAVLPSIIDTPANRQEMQDADFSAWVTTTELANVIAFLISPSASGITGSLIPVTGRV